jgi:hypothetical protein
MPELKIDLRERTKNFALRVGNLVTIIKQRSRQ